MQQNQLKATYHHPVRGRRDHGGYCAYQICVLMQYAVLDCCFADSSHSFSGGLDRTLFHVDLTTQQETTLGCHDDAIRCVEYCQDVGLAVTGSWDKTIKLWDPRQKHSVGERNASGDGCVCMCICEGVGEP